MKQRPKGFLAELYREDHSEVGDYISELHDYLWRVVRAVNNPGCGGYLGRYVDQTVEELERRAEMARGKNTVLEGQTD